MIDRFIHHIYRDQPIKTLAPSAVNNIINAVRYARQTGQKMTPKLLEESAKGVDLVNFV